MEPRMEGGSPQPSENKTIVPRRRRRWLSGLFPALLLFGLASSAPPPTDELYRQIESLTADLRFDRLDWTAQGLLEEVRRRLDPPPLPDTYRGQRALVDAFLTLEAEIRDRRKDLHRIAAADAESKRHAETLALTLRTREQQQEILRPRVETLLSRQVETLLNEEGFALKGHVIPPVAFRFAAPPTLLVTSPRDAIRRIHVVGLEPDLDGRVRTVLEEKLHRRVDMAGYVCTVSGLGGYPAMVGATPDLPYLLTVIAHEWTHAYLHTFPTRIAWAAEEDPLLTTINETVASLVGEEIGRRVLDRFYPDLYERLPPPDGEAPRLRRPLSDFQRALRRIRQQVLRLLGSNRIEEAEIYMEVERMRLVEEGYPLRRLNQAYLAFHGAYALNPASVSPVGAQIRRLRKTSRSLGAFLDKVGWLDNDGDYAALLAAEGIP